MFVIIRMHVAAADNGVMLVVFLVRNSRVSRAFKLSQRALQAIKCCLDSHQRHSITMMGHRATPGGPSVLVITCSKVD